MNISGFVNNLKGKMRDRETKRAESAASNLKKLKDERVRVEGQRKVYDLQAREKAKLSKAKQDVRRQRMQSNFLGSVGLKVADEVKKEYKKKGKGKKKPNPSMSLLPSGKDHPLFRK